MDWKITTAMPSGEEITIDFSGYGLEHYGACELGLETCVEIAKIMQPDRDIERLLFESAPRYAEAYDCFWDNYTDEQRAKIPRVFARTFMEGKPMDFTEVYG